MPESLTVTNNTAGQQPATTDSAGATLQQTQSSESLGLHNNATPAPANQDELMAFLRSESAGPTYGTTSNKPSMAHTVGLVALVVLGVVVASFLLVFYQKLFSRRLHSPK